MEHRLKAFFVGLYALSGIGFVLSLFLDRILPIHPSLLGLIQLVLLIVLLVPVVVAFVRWQGIRRYRTPYDAVRKRQRRSAGGGGSKDKPYDFFISYKSEDAMRIRPLVEQMLASGLNVWFAEYNITLNSWDAFEREIEAGISNARYGLCFTNKNYIESLYCVAELDQLLAPGNCGPSQVIEIQFPPHALPHQRYPQLKNIPVIQYQDDPDALMAQINQITGQSILSALPVL